MSRYKLYVFPSIGSMKISSITEQTLQDIINKAYAQKGLAAKTLQNIRGDLSSFFRFCRRKKVTSLNPEDIKIPASATRPHKSVLQPKDLAKMFDCSRTMWRGKEIEEPFINAFRFEVLTGLRPGELNGLQWSDVLINEIHVKRAINMYGEVTSGKNDNAIRTVILPPIAKSVLDAQRVLTGTLDAVFDISNIQTYRKHWQRYCAHNDIAAVTPYELRHTFVSVAKVLPDGQVKSIVGHSKDMDTFGIYGHAIDGEDKQTALQIDTIFKKLIEKTYKRKR